MSDDNDDNRSDDGEELLSRTQLAKARKADEQRLAELAAALVGMSARQLGKLQLSEQIVDAVQEARRMTAHAARARQLRIVRRELRDGEHQAIFAAVDELLNPRGRPTFAVRQAQAWAERLVTEGDAAVEAFVTAYSGGERQRLKLLSRNARKGEGPKLAKARKALTTAIQAAIEQSTR